MILLRKTKLTKSRHADSLRRGAVCMVDLFSLGKRRLSDHDADWQLLILMGVSNLDKTSEQVGFPVLEKRMAEFFDVSLEQPQFTLQSDCIGLQLCESSFDLLVEGLKGIVTGVEGLY